MAPVPTAADLSTLNANSHNRSGRQFGACLLAVFDSRRALPIPWVLPQ